MRISKERQDSNIRIGLLESSITRAIVDVLSSDVECTYLEIVSALANAQTQWLESSRRVYEQERSRRAYEQSVLEEGVSDEQK